MSAEMKTTSSSTLRPEGHTFLANVAMNGKKVQAKVNQPVLTAGTTNIVTLLESSSKAAKTAGSASTATEKVTKNIRPVNGGDND